MPQSGSSTIVLVIATRNLHKVEEIRSILGEQFQYRTLNDFPGAPKVVEDANSFAGNAMKKAVELATWLRAATLAEKNAFEAEWFVLADDSGLEVDALHGEPGVHSARFAALEKGGAAAVAGNAVDAANNAKLLRLLEAVPLEQRTARFRCVLALAPVIPPSPEVASAVCPAGQEELQTELFDGVCEGRIGFAPAGRKGFGYDPLFVPLGHEHSFAQLGESVKNRISHRARALQKLRDWWEKRRT